jgi:hypothetical protein
MIYESLFNTTRAKLPTLLRVNDVLARLMTDIQTQAWVIWQTNVTANQPASDEYVLRAPTGTDISDHFTRALRDYGRVFIDAAPGAYKISRTIDVPPGARIRSNGATIHLDHQLLTEMRDQSHTKHGLRIPANASDIVIDGLRFTGKHTATDWTNGQQGAISVETPYGNTGHDLTVSRCWFENLTGFSVQCFEHFDRITFAENVMLNCGNGCNTHASHQAVTGNLVIGPEAFECAVLDTLLIEHNLILSTRMGISIGGLMDGESLRNQVVRDNVLIFCNEGGYPYSSIIVADGCVGAVVENNLAFGWGNLVVYACEQKPTQFVRDTITRNNRSWAGLNWQIYQSAQPNITGTQVLSNIITGGPGVRIGGCATVRGNLIDNGSGIDYWYDATAVVTIADNYGSNVSIQPGAQVTSITI